jgi:cell division protein FtsI/penicillin-binding protein 2
VVSFAGYFPADDPEVAGIILVDNPRTPGTSTYGGTIAGPIFSRIGAAMARHLDLPARQDETEGTTIAQVPPANKPDGDLN